MTRDDDNEVEEGEADEKKEDTVTKHVPKHLLYNNYGLRRLTKLMRNYNVLRQERTFSFFT